MLYEPLFIQRNALLSTDVLVNKHHLLLRELVLSLALKSHKLVSNDLVRLHLRGYSAAHWTSPLAVLGDLCSLLILIHMKT